MQDLLCYCCNSLWKWRLPRRYYHHGLWVWYCPECVGNDCNYMFSLGHDELCTCPVPKTVKEGKRHHD